MANKRGQIAIFIVIGIIILLIASIFLIYSKQEIEPRETPLLMSENVQNFVEACVEKTTKSALIYTSEHGGYYNLPEQSDSDLLLPYYTEHIITKQELENEIAKYIDNELFFCFRNFIAFEGYEITQGVVNTVAELSNDKLSVKVNVPISVKQEDSVKTITDFSATVPTRLNTIYNASVEFMNSLEPDSICISCMTRIATKNNLRFEIYPIGNETIITIIDEQIKQPYEFSFIIK